MENEQTATIPAPAYAVGQRVLVTIGGPAGDQRATIRRVEPATAPGMLHIYLVDTDDSWALKVSERRLREAPPDVLSDLAREAVR